MLAPMTVGCGIADAEQFQAAVGRALDPMNRRALKT